MDDATKVIIKAAGPVSIEKGPTEATYYANLALVLVGPEEVVLRFALRTDEDPNKGTGIAKIYLGPAHAKRLMYALKAGIEQIESMFGEIAENAVPKLTPDQLKELHREGDS